MSEEWVRLSEDDGGCEVRTLLGGDEIGIRHADCEGGVILMTEEEMDRLAGWWLGQTTVLEEGPGEDPHQLQDDVLAFASEMEKRLRVYDRSEWPEVLTAGVLHEELLERVKLLGYTLMVGSDETRVAAVDVANVAKLVAEARRATENGG